MSISGTCGVARLSKTRPCQRYGVMLLSCGTFCSNMQRGHIDTHINTHERFNELRCLSHVPSCRWPPAVTSTQPPRPPTWVRQCMTTSTRSQQGPGVSAATTSLHVTIVTQQHTCYDAAFYTATVMHNYYITVCMHSCMQMLVHGLMCCLACPQVSCGHA